MPPSVQTLLAYFITWTTYGTWLPGDFRGWIKKNFNGVQPPNAKLEQESRVRMAEDAIELTSTQRATIEKTIRDHCIIRNWQLHAANARTNHVHVVVTADRDPSEVMNQLKAWCSRKLSNSAGLTTRVDKKQVDAIGSPKTATSKKSMMKSSYGTQSNTFLRGAVTSQKKMVRPPQRQQRS